MIRLLCAAAILLVIVQFAGAWTEWHENSDDSSEEQEVDLPDLDKPKLAKASLRSHDWTEDSDEDDDDLEKRSLVKASQRSHGKSEDTDENSEEISEENSEENSEEDQQDLQERSLAEASQRSPGQSKDNEENSEENSEEHDEDQQDLQEHISDKPSQPSLDWPEGGVEQENYPHDLEKRSLAEASERSSNTGVCRDDWLYYNGFCYKFINSVVSWATALDMCRQIQSSLLEITSSGQNTFIVNQIKQKYGGGHNYMWLNMNDFAREGYWVRGSNGEPPNYTAWLKGQPDNQQGQEMSESCAVVTLGGWHDMPCEHVNFGSYFTRPVCQKPA